MTAAQRALVVDLDETLSRTDTFHEAVIQLTAKNPLSILTMVGKVRAGKAAFKSYIADQVTIGPEALALNTDVASLIADAKTVGRKTVIASAADHRQVTAVAAALPQIDEAFGTGSEATDGKNLRGDTKAAFLTERFGEKGFDYVGDSVVDIPVWKAAKTAYAVAPSSTLIAKAANVGVNLLPIASDAPPLWRSYLRVLRPHQWVKNVLVFLPMLAAQDFTMAFYAIMAFVLFSMTASSVYIFNDLVDLPSDRAHPRKQHRPFAAGRIPIKEGTLLGLGLIIGSLILSLVLMPPAFVAVLCFYFAVTAAYSFVLKRKMVVDVITLAGLYTLRIVAGGAATEIVPSPWLLAFSIFLFYSLASIKRQAELVDLARRNSESSPGRGYGVSDVSVIQMIAISSGQAAVLVFALYLYSPTVTELYATPEILWLICPVLLYWLSRIAILTHRGHMDDDPIVFAAKDKISLLTGVVIVLIVLLAERGF